MKILVAVSAIFIVALTIVSAHPIRGLTPPGGLTTAFVSSPSGVSDLLIPVAWAAENTGLKVACFQVANTSQKRADRPEWPRVTAVGFELPGTLSGFSLMMPLDGDWELVEGTSASLPNHGTVTLDFAIMARVNPTGRTPGRPEEPRGIPPGQVGMRPNGTRFCVSGPFPNELIPGKPAAVEDLINGVVVGFHGVDGTHKGIDVGVWDNPLRVFPQFP